LKKLKLKTKITEQLKRNTIKSLKGLKKDQQMSFKFSFL